MAEVLAVIRREYVSRVKSKWFVFSTLGIPILMVGGMALSVIAGGRGSQSDRLVVVDETGVALAMSAEASLESAGFRVEVMTGGANLELLDERLVDGDIGGYVVLDSETLERGRVLMTVESRPSAIRRAALQSILVRAAVEARYGDDADAATDLLRGGVLQIEVVGQEASGERRLGQAYAFGGGTLLYIALLVYGIWLLRAVIEEKTNRTVEVILSAIRPSQFMLGKVVGVGAVGLTQIALWAALLVGAATFALPALLASRPELTQLSDLSAIAPGLRIIGLFAIFFVLGFLLYASMYAAAGAMCSTEQEAQQVAQPVSMLIIIPFILMISQLDSGMGAAWVTPLSFFPFFTPILMFARAASGMVPAWQIVLSILVLLVSIWGTTWVAGRIYRVGILMQGKRPTLPELLRWVREG